MWFRMTWINELTLLEFSHLVSVVYAYNSTESFGLYYSLSIINVCSICLYDLNKVYFFKHACIIYYD